MTKDFSQRTKLSTTRMFISTSATTFIPLAGSWALSIYGETKATAYMVVAIISTLMFSRAVVITWKRTWELTPDEAGFGEYANGTVHESHLGLRGWIRRVAHVMREYATTLRIREFRKHLTIFLLVQTSSDVFGQTFLFFVLYDWNKTAAFASLLLGCSIVSLPFMPAFGKAVVRFGVRKLYAFGLCRNAAWRGLAGIGMDSDGCSARCSMDGAAVIASLWFLVLYSRRLSDTCRGRYWCSCRISIRLLRVGIVRPLFPVYSLPSDSLVRASSPSALEWFSPWSDSIPPFPSSRGRRRLAWLWLCWAFALSR